MFKYKSCYYTGIDELSIVPLTQGIIQDNCGSKKASEIFV